MEQWLKTLGVSLIILSWLAMGCGGSISPAPTVSMASPTPIPAQPSTPTPITKPTDTPAIPTNTPHPTVTATPKRTADFVERPLAELSPAAASFLDTRQGPRGAAVVVPSQGLIYTYNGNELTPMASVAKLTIMVAVMDRAVREGRSLTEWELSMLRPMITVSDNASADALWDYLGGGAAVEATLRSMGLTDTKPNPAEAWGASRSTPKELALLLAKLIGGEILNPAMRDQALQLMSSIDPEQKWGVTAGVPTDRSIRTIVALKDGWNPTQGGWWVNSAGIVLPGGNQPTYTIAVLTRQQPSWEYGIATIEGVADYIHAALHIRPDITPTPQRLP